MTVQVRQFYKFNEKSDSKKGHICRKMLFFRQKSGISDFLFHLNVRLNLQIMRLIPILLFPLMVFLATSCDSKTATPEADVETLPVETVAGSINVVIEIPAGTNHKIEYNKSTETFEVDTLGGKKRVIDFLPYPGNYGFIPSTYMAPEQGGDGDALDVLVISESVPTGTVMAVLPIAALQLRDDGALDTKIIAIPADSTKRVIAATTFEDWLIDYDAAKYMVEQWFLNYKGLGEVEFLGWRNQTQALEEIEKWTVE